MNSSAVAIRPASTIVLLRDSSDGMEVFLLRRNAAASFSAGMYVFPGGAVDAADHDAEWADRCYGLDDATTSQRLGMPQGGMAHLVAAVRECFEESGLLLALEGEDGTAPLLELSDAAPVAEYARLRAELLGGSMTFAEFCRLRNLRLATDRLACLSRWVTPPGPPRRFDTCFFIGVAPPGQVASHDNIETTRNLWVRPADALEQHARGELDLMFPTLTTLKHLLGFENAEAALIHALAQSTVPSYKPRRALRRKGATVVRDDHPAYAEVGKIDPDETGKASAEIVPGVITRLGATVQRITAPNPGMMTGPGTNTYLFGAGASLAVLDPGPADPAHVEAIMAAAGTARIEWILVTHTHRDHSPAAATLKALTGAQVIGMPAPPHQNQDETFAPDLIPQHGDTIEVAGCVLRVLHTPGHASNHLCYLHAQESMLFTGDHIMQGSTVIINPPDGDMRAYLDSLQKLHDSIDAQWLAPAHGFLIDQPQRAIDRLIRHRQARERNVFDTLRAAGRASLTDLVEHVYADVPANRHAVASRSLLAHLLKLRQDGAVSEQDGVWTCI